MTAPYHHSPYLHCIRSSVPFWNAFPYPSANKPLIIILDIRNQYAIMASLGRHHSSVATTTLVKEAACRRRSGGGCPRKMCAFCIPASAPGPAREPLNFPPRPIPVHFTLSIEGRPHFPNSLGFISFADPHLLNPFTPYRYKNHGEGGISQHSNLPTCKVLDLSPWHAPKSQPSNIQPANGPVPRLPLPKTCILRTIGAGEALRQTLPGSHLFNLEQRGRV